VSKIKIGDEVRVEVPEPLPEYCAMFNSTWKDFAVRMRGHIGVVTGNASTIGGEPGWIVARVEKGVTTISPGFIPEMWLVDDVDRQGYLFND